MRNVSPETRGATAAAVTLAVVEQRNGSLAELCLTLAEGRDLLAEAQLALVSQQIGGWMTGQTHCRQCGSALSHKDTRPIVLRTVFVKVEVSSPRLWGCGCRTKRGVPRRSVSPLCKALPSRVTLELEYLQVKWTALLREVLPLDKGISYGSTRQRILVVRLWAPCRLGVIPPASHDLISTVPRHTNCRRTTFAFLYDFRGHQPNEFVAAPTTFSSPRSRTLSRP